MKCNKYFQIHQKRYILWLHVTPRPPHTCTYYCINTCSHKFRYTRTYEKTARDLQIPASALAYRRYVFGWNDFGWILCEHFPLRLNRRDWEGKDQIPMSGAPHGHSSYSTMSETQRHWHQLSTSTSLLFALPLFLVNDIALFLVNERDLMCVCERERERERETEKQSIYMHTHKQKQTILIYMYPFLLFSVIFLYFPKYPWAFLLSPKIPLSFFIKHTMKKF